MISNLFPTARHPRSGTFIDQRIHAHRILGNIVTTVALTPTPTPAVAAVLAAAGRGHSPVLSPDYLELQVRVPSFDYIRQARARFPSPSQLEQVAQELQQVVDLSRFDVIHAHGMYLFPAGALAHHLCVSTGMPYAVTAHGGDINWQMPRQREAYAGVLDGAGAVAYVSNALRDRAHALGAKGRNATVIPNGVDCELFAPADQASGIATHRLGPRVAFVGNLSPVKGADLLPGILGGIARSVPNTSFVIAGDGPLRPSMESAMKRLDVTFLGNIPQEQVAQVLRESDLAVLPSRSEGWPCVVLEAHASGTPMIGSDAGGTPEAIDDPRFIVAQGDDFAERFVKATAQVLLGGVEPNDLRSHALNHSWHSIAARETDMLQRIARRPSSNG